MAPKKRCDWTGAGPEMIAYHDTEWGVPLHDDRKHFEFIILDGAQAGLSWETILKRREGYRRAFDNFDVEKVARYTRRKKEKLLQDVGIIRNRLKVDSAVKNAQAFIKIQDEFGGFDAYVWGFVGDRPIQNARKKMKDIPVKTPEAEAMSKDLKSRGFNFVGPVICYAYMQAAGLVNDHIVECFRYKAIARMGKAKR